MYRITGHYPILSLTHSLVKTQQLGHRAQERWLVDSEVSSGRSDDDVAVNGDSSYRFG